MQIFFQILFWSSILAIFHSYVFYPFLLKIWAKNKKEDNNIFPKDSPNLPKVSILMAVFNEEEVVERKLNTVLNSLYPHEKLEILVGSDNSTDQTNKIVAAMAGKFPMIKFRNFESRQGKPSIINQLSDNAFGDIYILTDANVMFHPDAIYEMVKHYKNKQIGLVDTKMINTEPSISQDGISVQESSYISREVYIKHQEGVLWGTMMGPFGGCYSLRKELFIKVPPNSLVDDFYICMNVLKQKKDTINCLDAEVYEDVSNNLKDEFKRKIRIATGNFQNLQTFSGLLFSGKKGLSFSFISHKIIRWLGPFIILASFVFNLIIFSYSKFYAYTLLGYTILILLPLLDFLLRSMKIHVKILRFITHFISMNIALLVGFFKFASGVKSGVWNPTKRNQTGK